MTMAIVSPSVNYRRPTLPLSLVLLLILLVMSSSIDSSSVASFVGFCRCANHTENSRICGEVKNKRKYRRLWRRKASADAPDDIVYRHSSSLVVSLRILWVIQENLLAKASAPVRRGLGMKKKDFGHRNHVLGIPR